MIATLIVLFILFDGVVRGNTQSWAAPVRALLLTALILLGLFGLWRARVRLHPGAAILIGIGSAMLIGEYYYNPGAYGLRAFALYIAAFAWQRAVKRDWRPDFARAGLALAILTLCVGLANLRGVPKPQGAWDRNIIAGTLAMLLPCILVDGKSIWWKLPVMAGAIAVTTSRGGILAGLTALTIGGVLASPSQSPLVRTGIIVAAIAAPAAIAGLIVLRPIESAVRLFYVQSAIAQWWAASSLFGVGPGHLIIVESSGVIQPHAHNSVISLLAQFGLIGIVVAALSCILSRCQLRGQRWQWAALAAMAVHSIVDDPLAWWPTGLMAALICASMENPNVTV